MKNLIFPNPHCKISKHAFPTKSFSTFIPFLRSSLSYTFDSHAAHPISSKNNLIRKINTVKTAFCLSQGAAAKPRLSTCTNQKQQILLLNLPDYGKNNQKRRGCLQLTH